VTDLAIYDMDRTITRAGTFTPWLVFWALRRAPWRLLLLPGAAVAGLAYALKLIPRKRVKEINQALLMGSGVTRADLDPVADAFARRVTGGGSYADARAQIVADRAEGRRVVLATASNRYYVAHIARHLGIADVVATESVWHGDSLTNRIDGENCYAAAKLTMIERWLATSGTTRGHVRFYSDHISDLPVFDWADDRVAANPSPKLRALALQRGWRIADWG
jgi:phosphatidylglycerophosphatase C